MVRNSITPTTDATRHLPRVQAGTSRSTAVVLWGGALLVVLAASTALFMFGNYEVVNKGLLLPYTNGFVYEIEIADRFRLYVEPETRMTLDLFNTFILAGVGYVALTFAAIRLHGLRDPDSLFWFYALLSVGAVYLAADELLGIHESLGHNMPFLLALPGIEHPDDFIVLLYGIGAMVFLFCFRRVLLDAGRALWPLAVSILLAVTAILSDLASFRGEEVLEVLSGLFMIAGVLTLGLATVIRSTSTPPGPTRRSSR